MSQQNNGKCHSSFCLEWPWDTLLGILNSSPIFNRFGHGASHSVLLELETAMCDTVVQSPTNLSVGITKQANIVLQFCWDNFDLNEETPSGKETTHSTHGIVIQEVQGKQIEEGNMSAVDDNDNLSECIMEYESESKKPQTKRSKETICYLHSCWITTMLCRHQSWTRYRSERNKIHLNNIWNLHPQSRLLAGFLSI